MDVLLTAIGLFLLALAMYLNSSGPILYYYIKRQSVWLYIPILLKTIVDAIILRGR